MVKEGQNKQEFLYLCKPEIKPSKTNPMTKYKLIIRGVHYGANGDFVAGQKDTEEMHVRTREMLGWLERERPLVVLAAEPNNHVHEAAIKARSKGKVIGRVAKECVNLAWSLLRQSGQPMIIARVSEVAIENHGYVVVTVDADELQASQSTQAPATDWRMWMSNLPLLPSSELLEKEMEATCVIDHLFLPRLAEADITELKSYLDLWVEGSCHDLSYEACQKRAEYIRCLEAMDDKDIRQLAEPLKAQQRKMCERAPLDEHATTWWTERLESSELRHLWRQWQLKNEGKLWLGLRRIDAMLRQMPGNIYNDIGQRDVVLSRLYYLDTPRLAFQSILAMMMLRELTCRELGIEMKAMNESDYLQDDMVTNPMDMPTTIGRVVAFGETQCEMPIQRQTIQLLAQWLRDDYEQSHSKEIEALAKDMQLPKNVTFQNPTINGPIYGISGNSNVNLGG